MTIEPCVCGGNGKGPRSYHHPSCTGFVLDVKRLSQDARVVWSDPQDRLRVVETPKGPIVELPDGRDSLGAQRWIRAVLSPDRLGIGEPVIEGWPAISTASGYSVSTLRRWRKRTVNPLPLQKGPRGYRITRSVLKAWLKATGAI